MNSELTILRNLLKHYRYDIEDDLLEIQFLTHPHKSSLRSITDTLDHFKIENVAAEISVAHLKEMNAPFVAHLKRGKEEQFVLVLSLTGDHLDIFDGKSEYSLTMIDFSILWQGIVVVVEENQARRSSFTSNDRIITLSVCTLSVPFILMLPVTMLKYYSLGTLGILLSIFMLQKELGYGNNLVKKICGSQKDSGCDEVLKNAVKLPFGLSLADLSLAYFLLLNFTIILGNLALIKLLGFLTIPVIIFSFLYQAVGIKKWCRVCLGILGVLILQLLINLFYLPIGIDLDAPLVRSIVAYFLFFSIFVASWRALKRTLVAITNIKELEIENLKFRRDEFLFLAGYNAQKKIDTLLPFQTPEIVIGNRNAGVELIMVSNPLCAPCAKAHLIYSGLIERYPDDVLLRIRFFVPFDDESDPRTVNANHLLAIHEILSGDVEMKQVLHQWYSHKTFSDKSRELLKRTNSKEYISAIKIHREWCSTHSINTTPTLFINGRLFSDNYRYADIENFIEILVEHESNNQYSAYKSSYIYDN